MITQATLKELFDLSENGVFTRKSTGRAHSEPHKHGYVSITIGGKKYLAHRLVWLWHYGTWPNNDLDHVNRVHSDNELINLKKITNKKNYQNHTNQNKYNYKIKETKNKHFETYTKTKNKTQSLNTYSEPDLARLAYTLHTAHNFRLPLRKYRGVSFNRAANKWYAYAAVTQKSLGYFLTEQEALDAVKKHIDEELQA